MKRLTVILSALLCAAPFFASPLLAQSGPRDPLLDGPSIFSANRASPGLTVGPIGATSGVRTGRQSLSFLGVTRDDKNVMTAFIQIGGDIVQLREGNVIPGDGRTIVGISFQSLRISSAGAVQELPIREMSTNPAQPPSSPRVAPGTPMNGRAPAVRRRGRDAVPL